MFTLYELSMSAMYHPDNLYINDVYDLPEIKLRKCCMTVARYIICDNETVTMRNAMDIFLKYGCRKCMKIVLTSAYTSWPNVCETLAGNGRLDPLRYAIEFGYPHNINVLCRAASAGGHVNVLMYLREYADARFTSITSLIAARRGHTLALDYILGVCETVTKRHADSLYVAATTNGHLEVVKYLHEHGYACKYNLCNVAAATNNLDVLKYANTKMNMPCTSRTAAIAMQCKFFRCIIYTNRIIIKQRLARLC